MSEQIPSPQPAEPAREAGAFVAKYAAVIVKNVLGWALMLSALVLGSFFPVPIGTPLFLIGFALITLPGKRRLTSSALRGIPIRIYTRNAFWWRLAISLLLPPAALWFLAFQRWPVLHPSQMTFARLCTVYAVAIGGAWILTYIMLRAINVVVKILPKVRRRVRPWMRDHGINLLPPRRKRRYLISSQRSDDEQILTFNASQVLGKDRDQK
jgi:hypothetical protein